MELSLYALLPLLSAAALILLLLYVQHFQGLPAVQPFMILLLFGIAYSLAAALVILSDDLSDKIFWAGVRLSAVSFENVFVLATAFEFTRQGRPLPKKSLLAVSFVPAITTFLALSSSPLIFYDYRIEKPYPFLVSENGAWFWIYVTYAYVLNCMVLILLLRSSRRQPAFFARQHLWLLVGLFFPLVFDMLYMFRIFPRIRGFNLSPGMLTISAATLAFAIARFRLFDVMPIARYKVIETMHDGMIVINTNQRLMDINPAAEHVLKTFCPVDYLIGAPLSTILRAYPEWAARYEAREPAEIEVQFAGERFYQVRIEPLNDERHRHSGYLTLLHDISVSKRTEKALQEREERLRLVLDNIPIPVFMSSAVTNRLMYLNEQGAKMAGLPKEQAIGHPMADFFADPAVRDRLVAELQAKGSLQGQALLKRADGTVFPALVSGVLTDYRGEQVFLSGVHDITVQKQAELHTLEIMAEREKVSALQSFIQSASHDFRTPLSTIMTTIYLINKFTDDLEATVDDSAKEVLQKLRSKSNIIRESSERLTQLTDSMLEITRLEREYKYRFAPCDFNYLIEALVSAEQKAAQRKLLDMQFDADPALPSLQVDAVMLRRAIKEVLDNAIHYTPEQGQIRVQTSVMDGYVVLTIRDTGVGIAETDLPHIFTAFYRGDKARSTKTGGAGLGLTIAKRIIDAHSGDIEVQSMPGQGSSFHVRLPVDNSPIVQ